jgi:hypothetical protein
MSKLCTHPKKSSFTAEEVDERYTLRRSSPNNREKQGRRHAEDDVVKTPNYVDRRHFLNLAR